MIPSDVAFWFDLSEERQVELLHYEMIRETQEAEFAFGPVARKAGKSIG